MPGKSPLPRSFSHSQTTARQRKVIDLLANGVKPKDIAAEMGGITENGVRKLMARALAAQAQFLLSDGAFATAAAIYLTRHDALLAAWFPHAIGGFVNGEQVPLSKDAADIVMKLMNMYADVYGLKAPVKVQPVAAEPAPTRPTVDLVSAVMDHLDELAARMGPPPVILEEEVTGDDVPEGDRADL